MRCYTTPTLLAAAAAIMVSGSITRADDGRSPRSGRPATSVWAIEYDYGEATAAEPDFQNKEVWPFLTGKEYFLKTEWPKAARTLAWSRPGTSGGRSGPLDPLDPKNWIDLQTGEPADSLPDRDTDVVIPAADKPYEVSWRFPGHGHKEWGPPLEARHVTVGANAHFFISDARLRGNVWVQRGGHFNVDVTLYAIGSDHTFHRNDNTGGAPSDVGSRDRSYLCQYLMFNKATPEASTEFLGMFHSGDEFQIARGTLIIGPDTVMEMGRESSPYIERSGRIVLLDNAYLGKWTIDLHCCDMQVRGGTLQAGLPDRPIRRSAVFRIGHKNHTAAVYENLDSHQSRQIQRVVGMTLQPGSTLRTYSTDVTKARLIITQLPANYGVTFLRPPLETEWYAREAKDPARKKLMDWIDRLPQGIDVAVGEDVTVDGVEFDAMRKGGLMVHDRSAVAQWKNVFWGPNNLAPKDEIIANLPERLARGTEY